MFILAGRNQRLNQKLLIINEVSSIDLQLMIMLWYFFRVVFVTLITLNRLPRFDSFHIIKVQKLSSPIIVP
jgi:hypothetical protein